MNIEWDASAYRDDFSFVPAYGADVMSLMTVEPGSRVVDLGCGNGTLSAKLAEAGYAVRGIDASPDMVALARREHPGIPFECADAADFHLDEPADAVFSNAVLHWIDAASQQRTLMNVAANLRPGGEFAFEFGGRGCAEAVHGTLEQLFAERGRRYPRVFYFPTIGEYAPLVEHAGLRVRYAVLFDRPTPLKEGTTVADWIRMFDKKPFEGIPAAEADEILREAEERLRGRLYADGRWHVDYVRIRMRAVKQ